MDDLRERLRLDLTSAMRAHDERMVGVLRTVLSSIANAEAPPLDDPTPTSLRWTGPIAGAAAGVGSTEVARRELGPAEVHHIVRAERDVRLTAATELASRGATGPAEALRDEAAILERYLG